MPVRVAGINAVAQARETPELMKKKSAKTKLPAGLVIAEPTMSELVPIL